MTAIDEANRNAFDSGGMQGDGDHVSRFERSLVPTCLGENARTVQLATPVRNGAFGALHIKVDLSMRDSPSFRLVQLIASAICNSFANREPVIENIHKL